MLDTENGNCKHGYLGTRIYDSWKGIRRDCNNKKARLYENYGGKGIKVCDRWNDKYTGFLNFLADMGENPEDLILARKDVNKDFEPENCQWSTRRKVNLNRTISRPLIKK